MSEQMYIFDNSNGALNFYKKKNALSEESLQQNANEIAKNTLKYDLSNK